MSNLPRRLPARMVVDLPNWVGDQMMAMPAVRRLLDGNRGGETLLHARPNLQRLLALVFPEAEVKTSQRRAFPLASAVGICRNEGRFEVGVTLRNAARAKILLCLAAKWTVGSRGEGAKLLLSERCSADRSRHQVFDSDSLLETLGLPTADSGWRPELPEILRNEGNMVLKRAGLAGESLVGLAPASARGKTKRWPAERFGRLARRLVNKGLCPFVIVGPEEKSIASEVCKAAGRSLSVVGPELDVAALAGVIAQIQTLVCNDSGPMHLAATFATPVVALFGPTNTSRTAPLGENHELISHDLEWVTCNTSASSPAPDFGGDLHGWMRRISVAEVEEAVMRQILHTATRPYLESDEERAPAIREHR